MPRKTFNIEIKSLNHYTQTTILVMSILVEEVEFFEDCIFSLKKLVSGYLPGDNVWYRF